MHVRITGSGPEKVETARKWMICVKGSFDPLVGPSEEELAAIVSSLETIQASVAEHLAQLPKRLAQEDSD